MFTLSRCLALSDLFSTLIEARPDQATRLRVTLAEWADWRNQQCIFAGELAARAGEDAAMAAQAVAACRADLTLDQASRLRSYVEALH